MDAATRDGTDHDLPYSRTPLIGRERELAALRDLLLRDGVALLVLTGPGGVGKTRLALHVAQEVRDAFANGVDFVDLTEVRDAGLVAAAIAQGLGLPQDGQTSPADQLRRAVRGQAPLLVLDNFEHVVAAAPFLSDLLGACPRLKFLVTSRVRLRLSVEHEYPVQPLALPTPGEIVPLSEIAAAPAVRLFVERAQAVVPGFELTPDNAAAIAEICHRLDGLPLALELAAARVKVLPPPWLLARLERRLPLLTGGGRDLPARQWAMRDTIAWSYELLSPADQALFRRLSVFDGGFSLEAAEAMVEPDDAVAVVESLTALIDASLVRRRDLDNGAPRFYLLETIREFGLEKLAKCGDEVSVRKRHADWCLDFVLRDAPTPGRELPEWLDALDADQANVRAALDWLDATADTETYRLLADALWLFWWVRGHYDEAKRRLGRSLALGNGIPDAATGKAHLGLGWIAHVRGDPVHARGRFTDSLAVARRRGDQAATALALLGVGATLIATGEPESAMPYLEENLAIERERGDPVRIALGTIHLAEAAALQGQHTLADDLLGGALTMHGDGMPTWVHAWACERLAQSRLTAGDVAGAIAPATECLQIIEALRSSWRTLVALCLCAEIALAAGRAERATTILGALDRLMQSSDVRKLPYIQDKYQRTLAAAHAALPEHTFEAVRNAGAVLSLAEAVEEGLAFLADVQVAPSQGQVFGLTPRELEVLRLLGEGRSNDEIGETLCISLRTAEKHVGAILSKLDMPSRTAAATFAVRAGLV